MPGRDIDTDGERKARSESLLPFGHLAAGLNQNPTAEEDDEVASLGDGNELAGWDEPAFGVIPANQRLESLAETIG